MKQVMIYYVSPETTIHIATYRGHSYEITLAPAYASARLNRIIPISLQWHHMSTITSHITGGTTVCSCASNNKENLKAPLTVRFRDIHRWLVDSLHKGQIGGFSPQRAGDAKVFHALTSLCHTYELISHPYEIAVICGYNVAKSFGCQ